MGERKSVTTALHWKEGFGGVRGGGGNSDISKEGRENIEGKISARGVEEV